MKFSGSSRMEGQKFILLIKKKRKEKTNGIFATFCKQSLLNYNVAFCIQKVHVYVIDLHSLTYPNLIINKYIKMEGSKEGLIR